MATKTKRKQFEQTEAKQILESVKSITSNDVISQINNLQIGVQKTLADLSASITTQVHESKQLDSAIVLKHDHLKELYEIEAEAVALDELRAQRDAEKQQWDDSIAFRKEQWLDEEKAVKLQRTRDEENWKYEFAQKKKRSQDELDADITKQKKDQQIASESLVRDWHEREKNLKAQETTLKTLQTEVAGFEAKVNDAKKSAFQEGYGSATAKFNHEIALLKKDSESAKQINDARNHSYTQQIENLHLQIEDISKQLTTARQDAKDIASKSIEGASNRQLAETLQKVVADQQGSNSKSK